MFGLLHVKDLDQVKCQEPQLMATIFLDFCNDVLASSKSLKLLVSWWTVY